MYVTVEAVLIKAIAYGESSRIFTLFTKEEGKLSAIAKGVKKPKSALNGALQLGNRVELVLSRGRTMDTITQAAALDEYPRVRGNARAYLTVSYLLELVNVATGEREPAPALYELLTAALSAAGTLNGETLRFAFTLKLLDEQGYRPDFHCCHQCGGELKRGFVSPAREGVVCGQCGGGYVVPPPALYALNFYLDTPFERLSRLKPDEATVRAVDRVCRHLTACTLDRDLRSARILDELIEPMDRTN